MNNSKQGTIILIVGITAILAIGSLVFNQMFKNHQTNLLIIEKCFDNFDEVGEIVVKKDGYWSPVSCEKK